MMTAGRFSPFAKAMRVLVDEVESRAVATPVVDAEPLGSPDKAGDLNGSAAPASAASPMGGTTLLPPPAEVRS